MRPTRSASRTATSTCRSPTGRCTARARPRRTSSSRTRLTAQWMATAKISASALSENYHQAGLRVWAGDDNWASVHMIYAGSGRDIEFIYETNGNPRNEAADKLGGIPADTPLTYYVRLVSDGQNLTAFYSYNGTKFLPVGRPASLATFTEPEDRAGGVVGPGGHHADGAVRLDPVRPGRHRRRWRQRRRRQLRGHDPRRGVGEDPRRSECDRQRRHLPDPGPAGRHLPDPQRRQEPDGARRAGGGLDGGREGQLRGHRPVSAGRDHGLRRRRELHEVRPHRPQRRHEQRREVRVHLREQRRRPQRRGGFDGQHPGGVPGRLLCPADVRRDQRHRPLLDQRDRLDPGRAAGAAAGERQDRPVRVLQ